MAGGGVALHPHAEQLALDRLPHIPHVERALKDPVERGDHPLPQQLGVGREILVAVRHPVVDHAGLPEPAAEFLADLPAAPAVLDPEFPDARVSARQREVAVHPRVGEEGGVEVEAEPALLSPREPALELLRRVGVAVELFAAELGVAGMQAELHLPGDEAQRLVDVRAQLVRRGGAPGIVARRRDAAGQLADAVEADQVVPLPAVHRHGDPVGQLDRAVDVDARPAVDIFCILVAFYYGCFVHCDPPGFRQDSPVRSAAHAADFCIRVLLKNIA